MQNYTKSDVSMKSGKIWNFGSQCKNIAKIYFFFYFINISGRMTHTCN